MLSFLSSLVLSNFLKRAIKSENANNTLLASRHLHLKILDTGMMGAKVAAHAVAGGIIAELQGGDFGDGSLSAGLSKLATVAGVALKWNDGINFIVSVAVGGTISHSAGGSFANGAVTAAYQFIFNHLGQMKKAAANRAKKTGGGQKDAQETQRSQNGLGAALRGFGSGVVSIFKGTGRAIRFVGRGIGVLGSQELADSNREGAIVDKAAEVLVTNEAVRNEVANQALNAAQNIELTSYNIGKATGRFVTGVVLSPLGLLAGIGDVTSTVENGIENGSRQLTDQIVESIILGN